MKVFIWVGTILLAAIIQTVALWNGIILGAIPTMVLYLGGCGLASGLCKLWDYRGLRSTIEVTPEEEEIEKPKWVCEKCKSENPTSSRVCKECGKYK